MLENLAIYKQVVAPTLGPLVLIVGWFFLSRDNDRRESRKELRALVDEYRNKVDKLLEDGVCYFTSIDNTTANNDATIAEISIKQQLDKLEFRLQALQKMDSRYSTLTGKFSELADALTGHPKFESRSSSSGIPVSANDPMVLNAWLKASKLCDQMELLFIETQVRRGCWSDD
ncbi:hypothetical protein [Alcaligenes faecalis]|uniref:Uncharacterized protein n=1 Tax=Alcaligenes faecalis TaxID=511 RepID=A0AB33CYR4_ALCFA|nr:hypothetical protein [Alcaligenes faecalis]ASR89173.1 hypothetical protein AFA_06775 [Alcaligenes faecalis]HBQ88673.1 hypothetical protein [Alcaligenes faecalis]